MKNPRRNLSPAIMAFLGYLRGWKCHRIRWLCGDRVFMNLLTNSCSTIPHEHLGKKRTAQHYRHGTVRRLRKTVKWMLKHVEMSGFGFKANHLDYCQAAAGKTLLPLSLPAVHRDTLKLSYIENFVNMYNTKNS